MSEIWRDVLGFQGSHQVSNHGRVRSLDREIEVIRRLGKPVVRKLRGKILSGVTCPNGYIRMNFERGSPMFLVHRLVAEVFLANPDNLPEVNHKDGVRSNNSVDNLEWVTSSENKFHSYRELNRKQHDWTIPVALVSGQQRIEFLSELAAAKHLGVDAGSIRSALKRNHRCRGWNVERMAA